MGADDLLANGKDVAVIDYHSGDTYQTTASAARLSYYGLQGTPTAWFDGANAVVGGNHTTSMYNNYLPKYNLRKSIQSDFTMSMEGSNSGLIDYELIVTIENVGGGSTANLVMHVVVTESDIQQSWQGMSELNHTQRLMIPNQNGTALDFAGGDLIEETVMFAVDPNWVNENLEVIVFIQNPQTKDVKQAIKGNLSDFGTSNVNDAALMQAVVPKFVCENSITPKVKIANYGLDNLTSLDIIYDVNGGDATTFMWSGNLATYETVILELDPIDFTVMDQNTFNIHCENPNGQADEFPSNNTKVVDMDEALNVSSPVSLALKLDDNPEEITWEIYNSQNEMLYSGGPYATAGQFIVEQFTLDQTDCYSFRIYDDGGDGLTGSGSYKLAYDGSTIFAEGKEFGFEDQIQFGIGLTGIDKPGYSISSFDVIPNPVTDHATLVFAMEQAGNVQVHVFNAMGELVYASEKLVYPAGEHRALIPANVLNTGIYFVRLEAGKSYTKKIVVN